MIVQIIIIYIISIFITRWVDITINKTFKSNMLFPIVWFIPILNVMYVFVTIDVLIFNKLSKLITQETKLTK